MFKQKLVIKLKLELKLKLNAENATTPEAAAEDTAKAKE